MVALRLVARMVLLALALLAGGPAPAATVTSPSITLRLESGTIVSGDTVVLEIESVGLEAPLDLAPLSEIASIGRETWGTRIAVIEGKVVEVKLRRIEIVPRGTGVVIVGPLTAGDVTSNSASVTVLAGKPPDWSPDAGDLSLSMRVSKTDLHVQEEVVLDVELAHRHPIVAEDLPVPDLSGLDAIPVYEERRTLDEAAGLRRIAWRYLVWPRRSGELVIPGVSAIGEMQKSRLERSRFSVSTEAIRLSVRPAQASAGDWWLPARQLRLEDAWSADVHTLNAGDEVVRTITVTAAGIRAVQIPDLAMPPARGLAITPLGSERRQQVNAQGMTAQATFRFRVRALSPIPVFPDTIRLSWFDTQDGARREAIIPARRINVGIPDREALLLQAAEGRAPLQRLAAWLRVTTGPGLLAAAALLFLLAAMLLGLGNRMASHWRRWRMAMARRRLVMQAQKAIRDATPRQAAAALDSLCRLPGGTALRPALLIAGAAAYGKDPAPDGWREQALAALAGARTLPGSPDMAGGAGISPVLPPL